MRIKKFNENNDSFNFNINDFEFYTDFNLGKKTYHFLYKDGMVEGDIIMGQQSFKDGSVNTYVSHINIIKGENLLNDDSIEDIEIFLDDNIDIILNSKKINEESATGGPASAGMGAVVSAQPSSLPGATIGANWVSGGGTTGSGDIGVAYNPGGDDRMYQKIPLAGFSNLHTNKKKRKKSDNQLDLNQPNLDFKPKTKVMSYTDFIKADINKPKKK